ncbi:MAG TPA: glycosyltransferase, partial [Polyangiaceae bacterium]|nr:glycosyltransferase [Polyangiaceae bacterium]
VRGHQITFYEPDAFERQQHRDLADPSWARVVVYAGDDEAAPLRELEHAARWADVLVKASGVGVYDTLLERAILDVARPGQHVIFWDVDAPATLGRVRTTPQDPFRRLIPRYDAIFTYGGGDPVVNAYLAFGARQCVPVYNALDPDTHHSVPPSDCYAADLTLLANRLPDREARVHEFFFEPARRLPKRRFLLGGSGWQGEGLPPNVRALGHVPTGEHNELNCSALAVLNIARDSMAAVGFSPATRVFEAAGAGACLITDAWEGIELFLEPEREVLVARDGASVAEQLERLSPERAREVGRAAQQRILARHTYKRRALQVEELLCSGSVSANLEVSA